MAYWDCPRCTAENSLDATCCWRCGFQNFGAAADGDPVRESTGRSTDGLGQQRERLRDEMKKSLEGEVERTRATLDRLAGSPPGSRRRPRSG
jgi:hypothetical protein